MLTNMTLENETLGYFQKRSSTVNVTPKNDIYVIEL